PLVRPRGRPRRRPLRPRRSDRRGAGHPRRRGSGRRGVMLLAPGNTARRRAVAADMTTATRTADVVVIGAGQAGLSAAYHLRHRGFRPASDPADGAPSFLVLDAEHGPGGAWRHRWDSLTMATVNG